MKRGPKKKRIETTRPAPPPHLTKGAVAIFEALVDVMIAEGRNVASDAHLIGLYSETRDYANTLRAMIDDGDPTSVSSYDKKSRNPLIDPYLNAIKTCAQFLSKLGLTATSKVKAGVTSDSEAGEGWMA